MQSRGKKADWWNMKLNGNGDTVWSRLNGGAFNFLMLAPNFRVFGGLDTGPACSATDFYFFIWLPLIFKCYGYYITLAIARHNVK